MSSESEIPSATVVNASPLTISVSGTAAIVSAVALAGQTLAPGDRGVVLFTASRRPIFLKTL